MRAPLHLHQSQLVHLNAISLLHLCAVMWMQLHLRPGAWVLLYLVVLVFLCMHRCVCMKVNLCAYMGSSWCICMDLCG